MINRSWKIACVLSFNHSANTVRCINNCWIDVTIARCIIRDASEQNLINSYGSLSTNACNVLFVNTYWATPVQPFSFFCPTMMWHIDGRCTSILCSPLGGIPDSPDGCENVTNERLWREQRWKNWHCRSKLTVWIINWNQVLLYIAP